jgi:hypothetical protein
MSAHRTTDHPPSLPSEIAAWRRALLLVAGFPVRAAAELAEDSRVDLHAVLELIDRGCPPVLAARIVAPLDSERRPR